MAAQNKRATKAILSKRLPVQRTDRTDTTNKEEFPSESALLGGVFLIVAPFCYWDVRLLSADELESLRI